MNAMIPQYHESVNWDRWRTLGDPSSSSPTILPQARTLINWAGVRHGKSTSTPTKHRKPRGSTPQRSRFADAIDERPFSEKIMGLVESLGYTFRMNLLDDTIEVNGAPITDALEAQLRTAIRDRGYSATGAMRDAWIAHAYKNAYHPIRNYLNGLTWHGVDYIGMVAGRIEDRQLTITYADGTERGHLEAFFRRWLIGAVAKTMTGEQNRMLVLVSAQGAGKSTFVRWLCSGVPAYSLEKQIEPDNREHQRFLATKFVWEAAELGSTTRRADIDALKSFLTIEKCDFRTPFAKNPIQKPALANFIGTVNPGAGFLNDNSGSRRFMTAEVGEIDWSYRDLNVDQLWAQAVELWRGGESATLTPEEKARQGATNEAHQIENYADAWIRKYFHIDPTRSDWLTTTQAVVARLQNMGVTGTTRAVQMEVSDALRGMGLRQHANARPRAWIGVCEK